MTHSKYLLYPTLMVALISCNPYQGVFQIKPVAPVYQNDSLHHIGIFLPEAKPSQPYTEVVKIEVDDPDNRGYNTMIEVLRFEALGAQCDAVIDIRFSPYFNEAGDPRMFVNGTGITWRDSL